MNNEAYENNRIIVSAISPLREKCVAEIKNEVTNLIHELDDWGIDDGFEGKEVAEALEAIVALGDSIPEEWLAIVLRLVVLREAAWDIRDRAEGLHVDAMDLEIDAEDKHIEADSMEEIADGLDQRANAIELSLVELHKNAVDYNAAERLDKLLKVGGIEIPARE